MVRIAHYINQFFAGIGGEDKADALFEIRQGAVGPGRAIEMALGNEGEIVQTLVCGDNSFHADPDANIAAVIAAVAESKPDLLIAGPAFNAGRYGLACAAVATAVTEQLGIPAVTGLFPEAPAVDVYQSRTVMVPTGDSAGSMKDAIEAVVKVGLRLAGGDALRPAVEDGRIPMGYRRACVTDVPVARRATEMLLAKLGGDSFQSEVALPELAEPIPPAAAVVDLSQATIALVTEGGLVPEDNPDRIESSSATKWARYPISQLEKNENPRFKSIHAGYDSQWVDADPDRMVPLDALSALAADGVIGNVHEYFYATSGTGTTVSHAERMGDEIAKQLISDGVHAVLVTSTWGTGTRCGATLSKMIEKNGVPSVLLTALTAMAKVAGANRIVASGLIPHTVGDPTRSPADEFIWRKGQVQKALNAAATPIEEAQVFADW